MFRQIWNVWTLPKEPQGLALWRNILRSNLSRECLFDGSDRNFGPVWRQFPSLILKRELPMPRFHSYERYNPTQMVQSYPD